jgi:3-hydroxyisobutyrate dehydrogenase
MAGHMAKKKHAVWAFDINPECVADAAKRGAKAARSTEDVAKSADVVLVMVGNDDQVREVVHAVAGSARKGTLIVITGTHGLSTMRQLGDHCAERGIRLIDAPVVYGMDGAEEGTLLSLCGGEAKDVELAKPALMSYSRDVVHVGPLGAGQIAKTCNNLLHWIHCVGNFEALALAKRYGIDAQRMREVLLQCPAENGTLRRWDTTKFTWQEKDMDVVMELAQAGGLVLPLTGQVDQLIKPLRAHHVKALLYGPKVDYVGVPIEPLPREKGGLGK